MRRVDAIRTALVCLLVCASAPAAARALDVEDAEREFAQAGLSVRAEEVVLRGERLVLVRLEALQPAAGGVGPPTTFRPIEIACAEVTLRTEGRVQRPHAASPCALAGKLGSPRAMPVFVAFAYPPATRARITVPLTVLTPPPPIQTTLRGSAPPARAEPPVARVASARVALSP